MGISFEVSFEQLLQAAMQLSAEDKLRMATRLRAAAAAESFRLLTRDLPETPEIDMSEIVGEVKAVRKAHAS